jgi:hypothetical protein
MTGRVLRPVSVLQGLPRYSAVPVNFLWRRKPTYCLRETYSFIWGREHTNSRCGGNHRRQGAADSRGRPQ